MSMRRALAVTIGVIFVLSHFVTSARAGASPAPDFLAQAEKNYIDAKAAVAADQEVLDRLLQEEAN